MTNGQDLSPLLILKPKLHLVADHEPKEKHEALPMTMAMLLHGNARVNGEFQNVTVTVEPLLLAEITEANR